MQRLLLGLGLAAMAILTAACSSGAGTPAPASAAPSAAPGDAIVVVAKDLKFDTATIDAPADEPFEIVLDNQEAAPHNIAIKDASGTVVFKGEVVTQTTVTNAVPALAAGTYTFFCEVHPDMQGTLTAG